MTRTHQLLLFNLRLFLGKLIAKLIVFVRGLRVNCLLTRYPIVWVQPNLKECIHMARLREHGYQISATDQYPIQLTSNKHILSSAQNCEKLNKQNTVNIVSSQKFDQLLDVIINLAEKDLLEL